MQHEIVVAGRGRPFVEGDSIDHGAPLVIVVPHVFAADECTRMIERIEELGPTDAPVSTTRGFVMMPDVRNNHRVMFDDPILAAELYRRLEPALPAVVGGMHAVGVNERFRCYRYAPGQQFAAHQDGAFRRDDRECSQLTLMVYLNEGFDGGNTTFLDEGRAVVPREGSALVFQHRLWHEGSIVTRGVKYVLRTDVMYRAR